VRTHFHLFVYGSLRTGGGEEDRLSGCERVLARAHARGTLYDLDLYPAFMPYGDTDVRGEVWRCPVGMLEALDQYEDVEAGLYRRIGIEVDGIACWSYVAGPAIAHRLTRARRIPSGDWLAARTERERNGGPPVEAAG
jgi:gamma-glutamylcyclotransferase (GGCT)/AIG2-like uncharacterized protein YtfP